MSTSHPPLSLSRRAVLGVASIAPVTVRAKPTAAAPIAERCGQWIAADAEIDRLSQRWAVLDDPRGSAAIEREQIEARLERLREAQADELEGIATMEARDLRAVVSKLAVVACLTREDGGPVHDIVADVVRLLSAKGN